MNKNLAFLFLASSSTFMLDELNTDEIRQYIACRQKQLEAAGIKKNDYLYIKTGRSSKYWLDILTAWSIGAIPVPLDFQSSQERLNILMRKAPPKAIIIGTENNWSLPNLPILQELTEIKSINMPHFIAQNEDELAAILFTSGTTGDPKGVMISYKSLLGNARATQSILKLRANDRLQIALGFQFVSALSHFLVAMLSGASLFTTEKPLFQAELVELIEENQITCFGGSPLQLRWIAEHTPPSYKKLRWLMSSGDHLGKNVIATLSQRLPEADVFTVYGLTELGGRFCILPPKQLQQRPGSVGKPIKGMHLTILNDNLDTCQPNEIGHVYASGDYLFQGYIKQETKELNENGFKTGDLGYQDSHGFLYLAGRSDNVFKSAGKKVSTLPITEAVMATNHFSDAIVMSVEDDLFGRVPALFFVTKDNYTFKKGALIRELKNTLADNHIPQHFIQLKKIPRTGSGKPKYKELRTLVNTYIQA